MLTHPFRQRRRKATDRKSYNLFNKSVEYLNLENQSPFGQRFDRMISAIENF